MTEAQQKRFYFPEWGKCASANAWRDTDLRVPSRLAGPRSDLARMVITLATQLALQEGIALEADHFRHACHMLALGRWAAFKRERSEAAKDKRPLELANFEINFHERPVAADKSSEQLDNAETDIVVCLFHILEDPTWLGTEKKSGLIHWDNPGLLEEHRVNWSIRNTAPEAYTRALSAERFGTRNWEALPLEERRRLAMTQNQRARSKPIHGARYIPRPQPVAPAGHQPETKNSKPVTIGSGGTYKLNPALTFTPKPKTKNPY